MERSGLQLALAGLVQEREGLGLGLPLPCLREGPQSFGTFELAAGVLRADAERQAAIRSRQRILETHHYVRSGRLRP